MGTRTASVCRPKEFRPVVCAASRTKTKNDPALAAMERAADREDSAMVKPKKLKLNSGKKKPGNEIDLGQGLKQAAMRAHLGATLPSQKSSTRYMNTVAELQNETNVQIQMRHKKKNEEHKRGAEKTNFFIEIQQKFIHLRRSPPSLPHLIGN
jgi:hypothetical protein